jgi:hypothetical protein
MLMQEATMAQVNAVQNEVMRAQQEFRQSILWFFLKVSMSVTNKRFVGQTQNYLLGLVPTGRNDVTYPLNAISSVSSSTNFSFGQFVLGLVLALSIFSFSAWGIIIGLLGVALLLGSFKAAIAVTNNSGQTVALPVLFFERSAALQFISEVNNVLAERN